MDDILQVVNLSKSYVKKRGLLQRKPLELNYALREVSFELGCGLYGILGPNGAGKSTLIRIMCGLLRQSGGAVLWNKRNISKCGAEYRRLLGYVPQQQALYNSYSGYHFLSYVCALKELRPNQIASEVERVASVVNLEKELHKKISAYSGGMRQRLLSAAALIGKPRLLIMDEPTAGLDPKERFNLRHILHKMSSACIVLIATHVVSDIEDVANKVILLKSGEVFDFNTPQNLISQYAPGGNLEAVYLNVFHERDS